MLSKLWHLIPCCHSYLQPTWHGLTIVGHKRVHYYYSPRGYIHEVFSTKE